MIFDDNEVHTSFTLNTEQRGHIVLLTALSTSGGEVTRLPAFALTPAEAIGIAFKLIQSAEIALSEAITDTRLGECATCKNFRMVDTRKHGQQWMEHCPDCASGEKPAIPTIPTMVELERKILG